MDQLMSGVASHDSCWQHCHDA